jgi:hypothetical protein
MNMKRLICLVALALVAIPTFAQSARRTPRSLDFASDFQTVPVMANTVGAGGAVFQTYVALLNPGPDAILIDVSLFDNAGTKHDAVIQLAAGELKAFDNFLDTVFDFTGGGAVTFRGADSSQRFIVSAEVWTDDGRYGTSIPALEFAGTDSPSFAPGITVNASTRTNVGCFNQAGAPNTVTVAVLNSSGNQTLGTVTLNLAANAWSQTALSTIVHEAYVRFTPSDAAVCYAVVVDNFTNDGRFIPAAEFRP